MNYKARKVLAAAVLAVIFISGNFTEVDVFANVTSRPANRPNQVFIDGVRLENVVIIDDRTFIQLREFVDMTNLQLDLDEHRQLINVFSTDFPPDISRETVLFPAFVEFSADRSTITKTYLLNEHQNPAEIDIDEFIDNNTIYVLTSMSRVETPVISRKIHTETLQVEVGINNIRAVLEALGEVFWYYDAFLGYQGELHLRHDSIRVEESGFRNEGFTQTETRIYPNLPYRDVSLVPRTITISNRELTLIDVEWTTNYTADGSRFTAHATYTRDGVRRLTTGYLATAEFEGVVNRYYSGMTKFVLTFQAVGAISDHNHANIGFISGSGVSNVVTVISDKSGYASDAKEVDIQEANPIIIDEMFGLIGWVLLLSTLLGGALFTLFGKLKRKNVTIYQVYPDEKYSLLAKVKMPEWSNALVLNLLPRDVRSKITENKFIIELDKSVAKRFRDRNFTVKYRRKSISEYIDPAFDMKTYQMHVDFNDQFFDKEDDFEESE